MFGHISLNSIDCHFSKDLNATANGECSLAIELFEQISLNSLKSACIMNYIIN